LRIFRFAQGLVALTALAAVIYIAVTGNFGEVIEQEEKNEENTEEKIDQEDLTEREIITEKSEEIIKNLRNWETGAIEELSHPEDGVIISPATYIDEDTVVLAKEDLKNLEDIDKEYIWGIEDGTGKEIIETPHDFFQDNLFLSDFEVDVISYNRTTTDGDKDNNIKELYRNHYIVEYKDEGSEKYAGIDWESLIFIFEKVDDEYFLIGIIKDHWRV